jgi:acyl dehydratase
MTDSKVWPNRMPKVGQKALRSRLITPHDIELFSEISGDNNPLHRDEEAARKSGFGGIVAQGGITSAILNALVAEDMPGSGTVFMNVNWNFKAPVHPGETITGHAEITKVRGDKPICELLTWVTIDDGTVVLDGSAVCYTMTLEPR